MTDSPVLKYLMTIGVTAFLFGNFIACGARMYEVSMRDDHDPALISAETKDPASPTFGIHAPNGWSRLPITYTIDSSMQPDQIMGLKKAIQTWETAVGKALFKFVGDEGRTGDSFPDLYSSLEDQINGNYQDQNWAKTGKPEVVLATTIWDNGSSERSIDTADIRFNTDHYIIGDSYVQISDGNKEVVDMESLALHELGHLLGLAHIESDQDPWSIMNPSLFIGEGLANRKLSKNDIGRIQKVYGCEGLACDLEAIYASMESGEEPAPVIATNTLEDNIDEEIKSDDNEVENENPEDAPPSNTFESFTEG